MSEAIHSIGVTNFTYYRQHIADGGMTLGLGIFQ